MIKLRSKSIGIHLPVIIVNIARVGTYFDIQSVKHSWVRWTDFDKYMTVWVAEKV